MAGRREGDYSSDAITDGAYVAIRGTGNEGSERGLAGLVGWWMQVSSVRVLVGVGLCLGVVAAREEAQQAVDRSLEQQAAFLASICSAYCCAAGGGGASANRIEESDIVERTG